MANVPPQFTNYPRPGYQLSPFGRPPGVYIEAIGDGWNLVKQDLGTWIGATVVYAICAGAISTPSVWVQWGGTFPPQPTAGSQVGGSALSIVLGSISNVILYGMCRMATQVARGQRISIGDMFYGFKNFGSALGTCMIYSLVLLVGFCLCVVPGFFVLGALSLVPVVAIDQGVSVGEAFRRGYDAMKPHAWGMLGVLFVAGLVQCAGALCCGLGLLVTFPVYCAVIGLHYHYFFPPVAAGGAPNYASPTGR